MRIPIKNKNQGFSLMEVLIAMIIIAVGLLGFLSLQLTSINSNQEGMAKSQANFILQDVAAKFRSNRDYIFETHANNLYLSSLSNYNSCATTLPDTAQCGSGTANCSTAEQAQFDVWSICRTIKGFTPAATTPEDDLLPNAALYVDCNSRDATSCGQGSSLTAYLFWAMSERRADVGQVTSTNSNGLVSNRCNQYVTANDVDLTAVGTEVDCMILDIMP